MLNIKDVYTVRICWVISFFKSIYNST